MSRRGRGAVDRPARARTPDERPAKTCARCGLPFTWRKKWARDWDEVRYCSDRCRRGRGTSDAGPATPATTPPLSR